MAKDLRELDDEALTDAFLNDKQLSNIAFECGTINDLNEYATELFFFNDEQLANFEQAFFDGEFDE